METDAPIPATTEDNSTGVHQDIKRDADLIAKAQERRAEVSEQTRNELDTLLSLRSTWGMPNLSEIKHLLETGADPTRMIMHKDVHPSFASDASTVVKGPLLNAVSSSNSFDTIALLLTYGAAAHPFASTALQYAMRSKNAQISFLLLKFGVALPSDSIEDLAKVLADPAHSPHWIKIWKPLTGTTSGLATRYQWVLELAINQKSSVLLELSLSNLSDNPINSRLERQLTVVFKNPVLSESFDTLLEQCTNLNVEAKKFLLFLACQGGRNKVVQHMIKLGVDTNYAYSKGDSDSCLMTIAARRQDSVTLSLLLAAGADVNARNHWSSPLHVAIARMSTCYSRMRANRGIATIELLLSKGADTYSRRPANLRYKFAGLKESMKLVSLPPLELASKILWRSEAGSKKEFFARLHTAVRLQKGYI
ncbi:hypothetical protein BT63DRAFT_224699 [Microthyrium microscopicum]|uniref:Uncharacterized protein n=1 Tax=Microthyrium microscopicum TaxID=703497 RepID=A0A6A6UCA0_9PEZI|nr:hypothetical protein BT63DRAFT_224699 [Microthyrium microscopicum]